MKTQRLLFIWGLIIGLALSQYAISQVIPAKQDSVIVQIMPKYDRVNKLHRTIFGENYRKEYSIPTKLPVLHISQMAGGLTAVQKGGGNQTKSLRLEDKSGNEWVLRSVEKYPEVLLPKTLQETFLKELIKDNMSAQHPFSALVVPVLSKAVGVPYTTPVIGVVAEDPGLGKYAKEFTGMVALLELREPIGKTDNTAKMRQRLTSKGDYTIDTEMLLKLKCLDVLIGDWDRHDDQWRWHLVNLDNKSTYIPVPRDRDQVFFRSEGKIQRSSQSSWFLPMMQGYERGLKNINWFLWEGREINSRWFNEIGETEWNAVVKNFCASLPDEVLIEALGKLPNKGHGLRESTLFKEIVSRRDKLPSLMNKYYHFFNQIVDIELSNKDERIEISDSHNGGLKIVATKKNDLDEPTQKLYQREFDPKVTKEIRIYLHEGDDDLIVDNKHSKIKLRITGGKGDKSYQVLEAERRIAVNDLKYRKISGAAAPKVSLLVSEDSIKMNYQPKDLYKRHFISPNVGFNVDDGLALGAEATFIRPGYRKNPYGQSQSLSFLYSVATGAFNFKYSSEWLNAIGKADIVAKASILGPSNTQNFFGVGNETLFEERPDNISYYRARFNLYHFNTALRWRQKRSMISTGLIYEVYHYNRGQNLNRFISQPSIGSSDSLIIDKNKMYTGLTVNYIFNSRDNNLLPTKGTLVDMKIKAYKGLNEFSNSIVQINPTFSVHRKLGKRGNLVLSERIGGGVTFGKPAFYQLQFLGGGSNLMGYRQYRFAGEQTLYNNLEVRYKVANLVSYVLPGEIGLIGLYDVGRVWKRGESSNLWHHGVGGGIYFAPASMAVIRLTAAHSKEGTYPIFAMAWRY